MSGKAESLVRRSTHPRSVKSGGVRVPMRDLGYRWGIPKRRFPGSHGWLCTSQGQLRFPPGCLESLGFLSLSAG